MSFQRWLDEWADSVLAWDYEAFRDKALLPFEMVTDKGRWVVEAEEVFEAAFVQYAELLREHRATTIAHSLKAVHKDDVGVVLHYSNHILRGTQRVIAPTESHAWLREDAGLWRAYRVEELQPAGRKTSGLHVASIEEMHSRALAQAAGTEFDLNAREYRREGEEND